MDGHESIMRIVGFAAVAGLAMNGCWVDWTRNADPGFGDAGASSVDGSASDGETIDSCGADIGFGPPRLIQNLANSNTDQAPSVTDDRLELVFRSNRGADTPALGQGRFFVARRSSPDIEWGPELFLMDLDGTGRNREPEISGDGQSILFASERRSGTLEIFTSSRGEPDGQFAPPTIAPGLMGIDASGPSTTADGRLMIIHSSDIEPTVGADDIYAVERSGPGEPWGAPQLLERVNTEEEERSPYLGRNGLVLYFEREVESGETAIYRAARSDRDQPFGEAELVSGIDGPGNETSPFVTADCSEIYFASDETGNQELYLASRL